MSWLAEYVRPKIRTWLGRRDVPDNLWTQCPNCQQMLFSRDLERNLKVCTSCGFHLRPTAAERLAYTFDGFDPDGGKPGALTRIELPRAPLDPLRFRDSKKYVDRLKEARDRTGLDDAILVAHGAIGGHLGQGGVGDDLAIVFEEIIGGVAGDPLGGGPGSDHRNTKAFTAQNLAVVGLHAVDGAVLAHRQDDIAQDFRPADEGRTARSLPGILRIAFIGRMDHAIETGNDQFTSIDDQRAAVERDREIRTP